MKSKTKTLIEAMQILANEIHSEDGIANAAIFEASERLYEQQKRIEELEQELQKSTDQNDLILDEFIRVKLITSNTEIHQLCERAHVRMRQNVPVIERNHRMEKRIAELERAQSIWISVEDELPDNDALVVVAHIYEFNTPPEVACCNFYKGQFFLADDGLEAANYDGCAVIKIEFAITHWMPLPQQSKVK